MPACGACAAPDAPSLCGGCRFAAYCGPACQRAAWADHKVVCKAIQADVVAAPFGHDPEKTHCDGCAQPLNGVNELCVGCRSASYCSAACYKAHWRAAHKAVCKAIGEARFARVLALATVGDVHAMHSIALFYSNGTGVAKDKRKMREWYRRAAAGGRVDALFNLGLAYSNGEGGEKDARAAVECFRHAADRGDLGAHYELAVCYKYGEGVTQDLRAAVKLLHRAGEAGHARAQVCLGQSYAGGMGVERDAHAAFGWYCRAAAQEYAPAQSIVAGCLFTGDGVTKDERAAAGWARRAAELGGRFCPSLKTIKRVFWGSGQYFVFHRLRGEDCLREEKILNFDSIVVYFHICQLGEWRRSFDIIWKALKESGLYDCIQTIRVGLAFDEEMEEDSRLLDKKKSIVSTGK